MIDFDVDKIREEIKDLSYKDKLELLKEKGNDIEELIEELQGYVSDISSLEDEIRTEQNNSICKDILQSLKGAGYNMELDSNGNLSFTLGLANFTIIMQFLDVKVQFYFNASQSQLLIRELINSILPEFKSDANYYSLQVPEEQICKCVVGVVDKLMKHKEAFLNV